MPDKKPPEYYQEQMLRAFAVLALVAYVVVGPILLAGYLLRTGWFSARFLLGQLGRPFGLRWFQTTRRKAWKTNFLVMPPDDDALAHWLARQPDVVASSVTREPYWIVFDCIRRGYFPGAHDIQSASTMEARRLGYCTGQGISIIDIED